MILIPDFRDLPDNIKQIFMPIVLANKKLCMQNKAIEITKKKKKRSWSKDFLNSKEWKLLRKEIMSEHKNICVFCGSTKQLNVDHILPKSKFKELALVKTNLQILCWTCNKKKSTKWQ